MGEWGIYEKKGQSRHCSGKKREHFQSQVDYVYTLLDIQLVYLEELLGNILSKVQKLGQTGRTDQQLSRVGQNKWVPSSYVLKCNCKGEQIRKSCSTNTTLLILQVWKEIYWRDKEWSEKREGKKEKLLSQNQKKEREIQK